MHGMVQHEWDSAVGIVAFSACCFAVLVVVASPSLV